MQPPCSGGHAECNGNATPITTTAISKSKLGSIAPRSAIREGMAKWLGEQVTAIRAPMSVPAPAAAIPMAIPTIVVCIGEKPSASSIAYWRRLSA
jgi:hypothetical protein